MLLEKRPLYEDQDRWWLFFVADENIYCPAPKVAVSLTGKNTPPQREEDLPDLNLETQIATTPRDSLRRSALSGVRGTSFGLFLSKPPTPPPTHPLPPPSPVVGHFIHSHPRSAVPCASASASPYQLVIICTSAGSPISTPAWTTDFFGDLSSPVIFRLLI